MSTVTKFANANAVVATGWTSPTNAYADDGSYATAAPAKNGSISSDFGFPAFTTGDIPDGSTINSVTVEVQWKVSTTGSIDTLGVQLRNPAATPLGSESTETNATTADSLKTQQVTAGISLSALRSANVVVARVRAARGNTNTAYTASLDYVKVTVDYNPGQTVTPGAVSNSSSVAAPTLAPGAVAVTPDAIASGASTSAPTLAVGAVSVTPDAIASGSTAYAPALTVSTPIAPDAVTNTATTYAPALATGAVGVTPDAVASGSTVAAPSVAPGAVGVTPDAVANTSSAPSPTVAPGGVTVVPAAVSSAATVSAPELAPGAVAVTTDTVASSEDVPAPALTLGAVSVTPNAAASAANVFAPSLVGSAELLPEAVASSAVVFAPSVAPGAVDVSPDASPSDAVAFSVGVTPGAVAVTPDDAASASEVFEPDVDNYQGIVPAFVGAVSDVMLPSLSLGSVTLSPGPIFSTALVFDPSLVDSGPEGSAGATVLRTGRAISILQTGRIVNIEAIEGKP